MSEIKPLSLPVELVEQALRFVGRSTALFRYAASVITYKWHCVMFFLLQPFFASGVAHHAPNFSLRACGFPLKSSRTFIETKILIYFYFVVFILPVNPLRPSRFSLSVAVISFAKWRNVSQTYFEFLLCADIAFISGRTCSLTHLVPRCAITCKYWLQNALKCSGALVGPALFYTQFWSLPIVPTGFSVASSKREAIFLGNAINFDTRRLGDGAVEALMGPRERDLRFPIRGKNQKTKKKKKKEKRKELKNLPRRSRKRLVWTYLQIPWAMESLWKFCSATKVKRYANLICPPSCSNQHQRLPFSTL